MSFYIEKSRGRVARHLARFPYYASEKFLNLLQYQGAQEHFLISDQHLVTYFEQVKSRLTTVEKLELYFTLFKGRRDVYARSYLAENAIQAGAAGIWVSNHGGRQLNGGPASFDVLCAIADRVNKSVPIVFDSGVRRGSHVFKVLANGADIVALGRPIVYGLALGGAQGTQSVVEHLNKELKIVMQLAGTQNIEDIKRAPLIRQNPINDSFLAEENVK